MKTVAKADWPAWIKGLLREKKNMEVKESNGHFYLYGYRNRWNSKRGCSTKTTKYLGSLKERGGKISEHGHVAFLYHLLSKNKILEKLKKHFPADWEELLLFSMNRVIYPSPLKRMGSWAEKTTLENLLSFGPPSGKRLSKVLAKIGRDVKSQSAFMKELIEDGEMLLYDGSVIFSSSGYNKLLETGYNKDKLLLPKANITLLFSKHRDMPVYFRLFFGSVHEIKTIQTVIQEIRNRDILFICDKGYYKNKLYDGLNDGNIRFICPLPRDDKRIDYSKQISEVFEYHKRIIRCTSYNAGQYYLYRYEDQHLKYVETTEYYKLALAGRNVKLNEQWAGSIALLSNVKLEPKEAYLLWKTRDSIEKAFDALQNYLETDRPYVSREYVFRGYMFASFVALLSYYLILNALRKAEVNDKVSVEDVMFEFSKVMIEDRGCPCFAEIPAKVEELAKKLNVYDIITKFWES